jgi:DNA-binding NarL/FixJ family response regulator
MRILLADPQAKVRFALRVLLERQPGLEVVGEADSAEGLLAHIALSAADLVLLDWNLAGAVPARLLLALRHDHPGLVVVALSSRPESRQAALSAGADAFVSKGNPPEHLLAAVGCCYSDEETDAGERF